MITTPSVRQAKLVESVSAVEIMGLKNTPVPGDLIIQYDSEKVIKEKIEKIEEEKKRVKREQKRPISIEELFEKLEEEKKLKIILKADTFGSLEAVKSVIESIDSKDIKIEIIHTGVGRINESDVLLAVASGAIILGFSTKEGPVVKKMPERGRVKIFLFDLIYDLQEWLIKFIKGMIKPELVEVTVGKAEVKRIFKIKGLGLVAGCIVREGKIVRDMSARIIRNGEVIGEGKISSLKRFKEDVKEVSEGYECGLRVEGVKDISEGDIVEVYEIKEKGS